MSIDTARREIAELAARRPMGGYRVVYCDPPWLYENWSKKGEHKNATAQYDCLSVTDLKTLPVESLAAENSVMFMWATWPMIFEAYMLMKAWGFTYKTGGPWVKLSKTGAAIAFATGYIFRSASEAFLLGTRGDPRALNRSTRNLLYDVEIENLGPQITDLVREHSRKPDCAYPMIEALFPGPYLELFGRNRREGWKTWGNEVDKFAAAP